LKVVSAKNHTVKNVDLHKINVNKTVSGYPTFTDFSLKRYILLCNVQGLMFHHAVMHCYCRAVEVLPCVQVIVCCQLLCTFHQSEEDLIRQFLAILI
jgi:hypothetical protein